MAAKLLFGALKRPTLLGRKSNTPWNADRTISLLWWDNLMLGVVNKKGRWMLEGGEGMGFSFDIMRMFGVRFYDMSDRSNGYWRCCNVIMMLYVLFYNACTQILYGFHIMEQNTVNLKVFFKTKLDKIYLIHIFKSVENLKTSNRALSLVRAITY